MGQFAIPLMIASMAVSAGAAVQSGRQAQAAGAAEAKQLKQARADEALAGRQRALAIQKNLRQTLSGQRALMASRSLDLSDPGTPATIARATERAGKLDLLANQISTSSRLGAYAFQAGQAQQAGQAALNSGYLGAVSSGLGGAFNLSQVRAPAGGGSTFAAPARTTTASPAFGGRATFGRSLFAGT